MTMKADAKVIENNYPTLFADMASISASAKCGASVDEILAAIDRLNTHLEAIIACQSTCGRYKIVDRHYIKQQCGYTQLSFVITLDQGTTAGACPGGCAKTQPQPARVGLLAYYAVDQVNGGGKVFLKSPTQTAIIVIENNGASSVCPAPPVPAPAPVPAPVPQAAQVTAVQTAQGGQAVQATAAAQAMPRPPVAASSQAPMIRPCAARPAPQMVAPQMQQMPPPQAAQVTAVQTAQGGQAAQVTAAAPAMQQMQQMQTRPVQQMPAPQAAQVTAVQTAQGGQAAQVTTAAPQQQAAPAAMSSGVPNLAQIQQTLASMGLKVDLSNLQSVNGTIAGNADITLVDKNGAVFSADAEGDAQVHYSAGGALGDVLANMTAPQAHGVKGYGAPVARPGAHPGVYDNVVPTPLPIALPVAACGCCAGKSCGHRH